MPPFATAHAFFTSQDGPRNSDFLRTVLKDSKISFTWCVTIEEKQILVGSFGIQSENWRLHLVKPHFGRMIAVLIVFLLIEPL